MVFDVWMADYAPGAFLRIIRERGNKSTAAETLPDKVGRTFVLNTDGTISPKGQPKLVFGIQRCLFRGASIPVSQYHPAVSQYPSIPVSSAGQTLEGSFSVVSKPNFASN